MRKISEAVLLIFLLTSCSWNSAGKKDKEIKSENLEYQLMTENTKKMKKIFFVLPSPIETSLLINNSGLVFQEDLLNSTEKLAGYSTSTSRAIALGIYCADLSYSGINEQFQTSIEYLNVTRNLAESLGILRAVDPEKIKLLEENLTNKELVIDVISEVYMESHEQLREQDRYLLASLMLIGGWVESLYLATQSVKPNEVKDQILIERILDQHLSLESVKSVLRENQSNPVIQPIYKDLLDLERLFKKSIKSKNDELDFYEKVNLVGFEQLILKVYDIRDYLVD
ncbi:hypothetical protein DF185_02060 [Marinifilum breve]|uniref:Lipoprotein n=1 Tax=Marinifilum breve TaxID=2184082 RepID=A0A2V4A2K3_9BACT|nr:hypothetical protein [Marinifilum breve]PXY02901.1 hypothetical protein DF185_02060 [Marinifilum breve]